MNIQASGRSVQSIGVPILLVGYMVFVGPDYLSGESDKGTALVEVSTETGEPEDLDFEQLAQIRVATVTSVSKQEEVTTKAPASVIVVDDRDILLRGYSQLSDVLRDLPGMQMTEYYFSEFGTQVSVRGISGNNKIVVLVNGMRVNPPGGENFPFRNDFSIRNADRVEVVYGAGSTLYGQDAISAVINVVTREPTGGTEVELGGAGGRNLEREVWGTFGGILDEKHDVKLSGHVRYHDSELTPLDREFPNYWQDYRNVAQTKTNANGFGVVPARQDFGLNAFARVEGYNSSIQVWYRNSERSSAEGFSPVLGFLPQASWSDWSLVAEGRNTISLSDRTKLVSAVMYNRYEIDPNSRYIFPASAEEWFLDDFKYGLGWSLGIEETLHAELSDTLSLLAGVAVNYQDIIPKATFIGGYDSNRDPVEQGGSFLYTDSTGVTNSIAQVSEVTYWNFAPYLEAQWQIVDPLRLVVGARVTFDDRFSNVPITPRAALVYDINENLTSKFIYTRAYVAPAPYFAFATYDNGSLLATTNPDLEPETADTFEINMTWNKENLSLGLSGFYGTQSDIIIVSDRAAPPNIVESPVFLNGDPNQSRTLVQTANGGDSRRYGADVYGRATFGTVNLWASYSYVDFEEELAGITTGLPGISAHNGRLGVTWAITPKFYVTPSFVIRSTPDNVIPGRLATELETPWELNMYLLYRATPYLDLYADLRNVTDHHYALGGFAGSAIPQETFHGTLGLRLSF